MSKLVEMSERETRDFMSVDAFSQLPFIRQAPAKEKNGATAIRLFGIEVPQETDNHDSSAGDDNKHNTNTNTTTTTTKGDKTTGTGGESTRKFECHYCCRNFPTSQALGGHQNAHKRERQHAKRAQFQSALSAAAAHHHRSAAIADGHMYGLINYHHAGPVISSTHFGLGSYPSLGANYGANSPTPTRLYGGLGSVTQPINGSPLPGLWLQGGEKRIHQNPTLALPLFGGYAGGGLANTSSSSSSSSSSLSPESRILCEPKAEPVKDHLSLDLHL